jgi:hypothetical protein
MLWDGYRRNATTLCALATVIERPGRVDSRGQDLGQRAAQQNADRNALNNSADDSRRRVSPGCKAGAVRLCFASKSDVFELARRLTSRYVSLQEHRNAGCCALE